MKDRGSDIEPCSTSAVKVPFTKLRYPLPITKRLIHSYPLFSVEENVKVSVCNPYPPNLAINESVFNVPMAFHRYVKIAGIYPPWYNIYFFTFQT